MDNIPIKMAGKEGVDEMEDLRLDFLVLRLGLLVVAVGWGILLSAESVLGDSLVFLR